jgi:hypothetical protein
MNALQNWRTEAKACRGPSPITFESRQALSYSGRSARGAIRKFECVVVHPRHVFVDWPKDRRPGFYYFHPPTKEAKWRRKKWW